MNNHYTATIPFLIGKLGTIQGRKKIQKIVHILQSAGAPFAEKFEFSYFGPYSQMLKDEMDTLVKESLITESYNPSVNTYSYTLNEPAGQCGVEEWIDFAKKLNEYDAKQLEALSTMIFLRNSGYDDTALKPKFTELKLHLVQYVDWASKTSSFILSNKSKWSSLKI